MTIFEINTKYSRDLEIFGQNWMNFRDCFNLTSSPNSINSKHTSTQFTNKTWRKHKNFRREKGSLRGHGMHHFKHYSFKWDVQQMI